MLISPMVLVMNLGLPYWDFIFTLIYSLSTGSWIIEGTLATIITTLLLAAIIVTSEFMHRRLAET